MLFKLVIFLFLVHSSTPAMVDPQYRVFWRMFRGRQDFEWFLQSRKHTMAFGEVDNDDRIIHFKLRDSSPFPLKDALAMLAKTTDHTIILNFRDYRTLQISKVSINKYNHMSQIWCNVIVCQGPTGMDVSAMDKRQMLKQDFSGSVATISWTDPDVYNKSVVYLQSHIDEMSNAISSMTQVGAVVVIFDAIIMSNTQDLAKLIKKNMCHRACLIHLGDRNKGDQVDVGNLVNFIDESSMWPFFFDLPDHMHLQLIYTSKRLNQTGSRNPLMMGVAKIRGKGFLVVLGVILTVWVGFYRK